MKIDKKDCQILELIQGDCTLSTKQIAQKVGSPITTVYAKIKRLEEMGVIKGYHAALDGKKIDMGTSAFIFVSFTYGPDMHSLKDASQKLALMPEVQEVFVVTGEWDIMLKIKSKNVDAVGNFVIDRLRKLKGVEKTYTIFVFDTPKEGTYIDLHNCIEKTKKR